MLSCHVMSSIPRREFLAQLSALAIASRRATRGGRRRLDRIGIQLYSLRSVIPRDPERTLAALASIGYRDVEMAGLYGKTATEFRGWLDHAGLRAPSGHVDLAHVRSNIDRTLADARTLGQQYLVVPFVDQSERTLDGYKKVAADLNAAGEQARAAGIQLAYHNHDFEFVPIDGVLPYDLLLERCDPTLVAMELDIFWITKAGHDPLAYFAKYPARFPLLHAKDMTRDGAMVDVGKGSIDFKAILAHADEGGRLRHVFVEHDEPPAPLDDARISYDYLSRLSY
jgi:sugar phosphate isomerase/epimerase